MKYSKIVTHPGGAHKDDLLACALLLASSPAPIERREPSAADLSDPEIAVIDVGNSHDPELGNFDHHQFPRDHAPTCSLSLVLEHLGLYDDARKFCDWLEPAEWFDCRGAVNTAKMLGVERHIVGKLSSPIDITLLRRFASSATHQAGQPLWEVLKMIGDDLVDYLSNLRQRIEFIHAHRSIWDLGDNKKILFLPRTEPLPEEPSAALGHYIQDQELADEVVGMVYPDRRNTGYGMARYNDDLRLDFTRTEDQSDVHFAHKSGFMAKTTATETERLQALVRMAAL